MATYNKFNVYTLDLNQADHDWSSHTYKVMLTNTAPTAGDSVKADITEISAGFGYTAGGTATTITTSTSTGTEKNTATDVVFTASGGVIGPFRYVALYNDTTATPAKPLVCWYDYGSAITLLAGESFTTDFDAAAGLNTTV